jgi:ATP synthase protein I
MANTPALKLKGQRSTDQNKANACDAEEPAFQALTREQAQALRKLHPPLSPWRVVGVQAAVGLAAALILVLITRQQVWFWSFLYGAATVVLPSALMARGISSPLARVSAGAGVVSFLVWEAVKVGVSVAMLLLAAKIVQPLSWPALLAGLVLCLKCYWVALLWRGSKKN